MADTARYDEMTVDELREEGKRRQISGIWEMTKDELTSVLASDGTNGSSGGGERSRDDGIDIEGRSKSLRYGKEISSPDDHEDRPGQTLYTQSHDVIRRWAEERDATPATVPGTEHDDHLGVMRFDFPDYGGGDLETVSWDDWFRTFDERDLVFIYQEHTSDGDQSNFFRLESPDREDG